MNSKNPNQATWRTSDGSPWWLRSSRYNEPNGDYHANCYMDLWRTPHNSENNIQMNDWNCNYHSRSYYCQPKYKKPSPPPRPPPPACSKRVVVIGGYEYATLDRACATAGYNKDKAMYSDKTCHRSQYKRSIPSGWELAPFERGLLNYAWSTHCLIFKDGKSYGTKGWGASQYRNCGSNLLRNSNGRYYASSCSRRVAIRRKVAPKNSIVAGGSIYMAMDGVNPHAGYNKDKGNCQRQAISIPSGWELAPEPSRAVAKEILKHPWSCHCLIFSNGQTRGTSTYNRDMCIGKGWLVKKGNNQYAAKGCSLRVLLRKKN